MIQELQKTGETSVCDSCPAEYFCTRLHTVLTLLNNQIKDPRVMAREDLVGRFREIMAELDDEGYAFPYGTKTCHLAEAPNYIQILIDELIEILGAMNRTASGVVEPDRPAREL